MTALVVAVAIPAGLALAWHLRAVACRWPDDRRRPSGSVRQPPSGSPRPLPSAPGPDGSPRQEAARCYLMATDARPSLPESWPLPCDLWEPGGRLANLVKAGGLFLAESERLARAGKPAADRLRRAALAVAEGLSNHLARQAVPAQREDHRP